MQPSPETVTLTVGTAGHIDHGKTELVKFFTGCETDRLPEEKARGMTIDLGFATCTLPDNRRVGIVDVPGHERFIHNMVAGATGIDVVLLVVAADDGVMPQTLEHFHIVRLLGVASGMVAVTKIDLVSEERVRDVQEQVRALVSGSFLDGCPIVPVSSKTGEGFEKFYDTFVATVDKAAEHDASGSFRMHVERSFVLKGLGTIVSGIPSSGTVRTGDTLELLPVGERKKVRGVQVYGQSAEAGRAGECVALRLADLSREDAGRGMVLATPGHFTPSRFVNARFHLLPELDKPLRPRVAVRLHIGTADMPGHLVLPELKPLAPGSETYAQFQLQHPVVAAPGDFFVVRLLSPVMTIGGGTVVTPDSIKMRRTRGEWAKSCEEFETAFREPASAIVYVLEHSDDELLRLPEIARLALLSEDAAREYIRVQTENGAAVALAGDRYATAAALARTRTDVLDVLTRLHDEQPLVVGFPKKQVYPVLTSPRPLVEKAVADLLDDGEIRATPHGYQIPVRAPQLTPQQAALAEKLIETYRKGGFSTPRRDELPASIGTPAPILNRILDHLVQRGDIVVISDKVLLHRDAVEESRAKLVSHLEQHGTLESGEFRNVLGTSRKFAIPILEYWDAQGLTRRAGNQRVLRSSES